MSIFAHIHICIAYASTVHTLLITEVVAHCEYSKSDAVYISVPDLLGTTSLILRSRQASSVGLLLEKKSEELKSAKV